MDLAEEGDLTKRFMGGVDKAAKTVESVFGGVFNLLSDADSKSTGLTSWLFSKTLDLEAHAVGVSKHNENIPANLFLISSGAWPRQEKEMTLEARTRTCDKIKDSLQKSEKTWKLFCDTDGDRRPSPFTLIAYTLCDYAIVPLHLNKGDLDRTETMLGVLNELRQKGEIKTQVLFIIWNFVKVLKDEPTVHNGNKLPFTPTKVCLDILDACNNRVVGISKDLPGLFAHEGSADADFIQNTTTTLKMLADNVLKPSEELGKPFVQIMDELTASGKKSMKFKTGDVEYTCQDSVIENTDLALRNIEAKFEAMHLGGGGYPA